LSGFNLHHTNALVNGLNRDCLYYRVSNDNTVHQVIEYCIRYQIDEKILRSKNHHSSFTFEELRKLNVTSYQLYQWSAPMDVVENYQKYLNNKNASLGKFLFYNCTYPWFGYYCEYRFDQPKLNFAQQVETNLDDKFNAVVGKVSQKLCNGKVDCLNGEHDEE
jgi:hypothetical protein